MLKRKPQRINRRTLLIKNTLGPYANKVGSKKYVKPGNSRTVVKVPPS